LIPFQQRSSFPHLSCYSSSNICWPLWFLGEGVPSSSKVGHICNCQGCHFLLQEIGGVFWWSGGFKAFHISLQHNLFLYSLENTEIHASFALFIIVHVKVEIWHDYKRNWNLIMKFSHNIFNPSLHSTPLFRFELLVNLAVL
jgi:hypothetical protein